MSGAALAKAAERLVGAPFRLHGRDPSTGLDCLGVVIAALAQVGRPVEAPPRYALRNSAAGRFMRLPEAAGFSAADAPSRAGDLLALAAGPAQLHAAIVGTSGGIVHAHAGLRRVVLSPFPLPWPMLGHWRLS